MVGMERIKERRNEVYGTKDEAKHKEKRMRVRKDSTYEQNKKMNEG